MKDEDLGFEYILKDEQKTKNTKINEDNSAINIQISEMTNDLEVLDSINTINTINLGTEIVHETQVDNFFDSQINNHKQINSQKKKNFINKNNKRQKIVLENSEDFIELFNADLRRENKNKLPKTTLLNPKKFYQKINTKKISKEEFFKSLIKHTCSYMNTRENTDMFDKWSDELLTLNFFDKNIESEEEDIKNQIKKVEGEIARIKKIMEDDLNKHLEIKDTKGNNEKVQIKIKLKDFEREKEILSDFNKKIEEKIQHSGNILSGKILLLEKSTFFMTQKDALREMVKKMQRENL